MHKILLHRLRMLQLQMDIWFLKKKVLTYLYLNQNLKPNVKRLVVKLGQVVTGFTDGYKSWRSGSTGYEARINQKIDQDFYKEEWEKVYSPIKAEKE